MKEPVLRPLDEEVNEFIQEIPHLRRREEAMTLLSLFEEVTGDKPQLWGGGIIGFGKYHYRYTSGREGDAPLAGFAPRKARHSIYVEPKFPEKAALLEKLGQHRVSLGCIYLTNLAHVDLAVLGEIIAASRAETLRKEENTLFETH